jgi:hypothetical protein
VQRDLLHVLLEDVVVEDALHGGGRAARPGSVIRSVMLHLHERNLVVKTLATATAMSFTSPPLGAMTINRNPSTFDRNIIFGRRETKTTSPM